MEPSFLGLYLEPERARAKLFRAGSGAREGYRAELFSAGSGARNGWS